jgi:hypothetical protein
MVIRRGRASEEFGEVCAGLREGVADVPEDCGDVVVVVLVVVGGVHGDGGSVILGWLGLIAGAGVAG